MARSSSHAFTLQHVGPLPVRRSLRLLLLNYEFPPLGGGAGSATYYMARALRNLGHRVDILTAQEHGGKSYESLDGVRVFRVPSYRVGIHEAGIRGAASYLFFARLKLARLIRENHYDLMHYYFGLPTGLLTGYSHEKCGVPYIVSLRGSDVPGYDMVSAPKFHRLLGATRRRIWHNAAAIVANSGSLREVALAADPDCSIWVIPNGVCVDRFTPDKLPRKGGGTLRILCVSRLVERKNLETLIRAFAELRDMDVTLEIVGTGKLEREIKALVGNLELEGRVHLSGALGQSDLAEHYRGSDLFVLPSVSESCAMALLEAMSSGLPAIVSDVGGNTEIVRHEEKGLLFKPASIEELATALRKLAKSPALRARMSENNIKKIQSQHSWAQIARRYEDVYRRGLDPDISGV